MYEVKFKTYQQYSKAFYWCRDKFGFNLYRWKTNYGLGYEYNALLFLSLIHI